jgi:hypothetical protein
VGRNGLRAGGNAADESPGTSGLGRLGGTLLCRPVMPDRLLARGVMRAIGRCGTLPDGVPNDAELEPDCRVVAGHGPAQAGGRMQGGLSLVLARRSAVSSPDLGWNPQRKAIGKGQEGHRGACESFRTGCARVTATARPFQTLVVETGSRYPREPPRTVPRMPAEGQTVWVVDMGGESGGDSRSSRAGCHYPAAARPGG